MSRAWLVLGLGAGDEGKGSVVDYLVRETGARLVVRFNGGCQASHRVVLADGRAHAFHQWGAGTFAGAQTYLGPEVVIDPVTMHEEAGELVERGVARPWDLLTVDPDCPVTTPVHRAMNRLLEEERGAARHGSCGFGVGEVRRDMVEGRPVITARDLLGQAVDVWDKLMAAKAHRHQELLAWTAYDRNRFEEFTSHYILRSWASVAAKAIRKAQTGGPFDAGDVVFEGAQGALLDEWHGFYPHTSWGDCTFGGAERVLARWLPYDVTRLGVLRAYATRHGAGPLPTESREGWLKYVWPQAGHNGPNEWQGQLRAGHFDAVLARYALDVVGGVDGLALTCLDEVGLTWQACDRYLAHLAPPSPPLSVTRIKPSDPPSLDRMERLGRTLMDRAVTRPDITVTPGSVSRLVVQALGVPVVLESRGPTHEGKTLAPGWSMRPSPAETKP